MIVLSFLLDPPALFFFGIVLAILNKKFLSSQLTRIFGFIVLLTFWTVSIGLFLDLFPWPLNLFDFNPPLFESIDGKDWMLHTDLTGIEDIPLALAAVLFLLYPVFLVLGYEITRAIIDPRTLKVLPGELTIAEVKSHSRARQKDDAVLLSAVRDPRPEKALTKSLELIGGLEQFVKPGDKVAIKPNICGGNPQVAGSFTSIAIVDKLVRMIRDIGGDPVIVDSDMVWTDFKDVADAQGWTKWAKENGVPLFNLRETDCIHLDFGLSSKVGVSVVSKLMVDADVIISVPTMKTHLLTNVTLGMKNMYGCFPTGEKAKYHKLGIEDVIVDINYAFRPTLTIIDGSIGGEAIGPLTCKPLNYETIICSNDVVAADALASFMMGYDPLNDIEHIQKAHELKLGRGDVTFDWETFPYTHPKDGKWIRPDPTVSEFYNKAIEQTLKIPTMKKFMNAASDFLLYDTATLPIFENVTPAFLGVLGDIFSAVFNVWGKLRGGRKKHKIISKIEEKRKRITSEDWPSKKLEKRLIQIGTTSELTVNPPLNALDITITQPEESSRLASEFNPQILLQGLELRSEKKAFGGIMYRVLENPSDSSDRCIQYLYTWIQQRWFFSGWYNILVPLFLAGLGVVIFSQTDYSSWLPTYVSVGFAIGFLLLVGGWSILKTLREWRKIGEVSYIYHHPYSLILYAFIFVGILFELPLRWNGETFFPPTDVLNEYIGLIYIPVTSVILVIIPIVVIILIIQPFFSLFTHEIDFAPVYVYIRERNSQDEHDWFLDKVRFDAFHHRIATRERSELNVTKNKRALLAIPNTWHSMTKTRGLGKIFAFLGLIGFLICYIALGGVLYFYPEAVEKMDLIAIVVAISLIFAYAFFALYQTKLVKNLSAQDFKENKLILNQNKVSILWNLTETDSAFKVRQKFQDPFSQEKTFWTEFYDEKDHKTLLEELQAVQIRTRKITSFMIGFFAVVFSVFGFYIGGFWEFSVTQLQTPNYGWILLFFTSFAITLIVFLIYSLKVKPLSLIIILILSALFAWIDEAIFTFSNLWTYLTGDPISLSFAILGWPIFIILIIGAANWILKYIRLPSYTGGLFAKIKNFSPVFLLLIAFGIFFYIEGGYDELLTKDITTQITLGLLIGLVLLFSILFGFTHSFKQNLVVLIIAMIFGGIMELLGFLCGYWNYFAFTNIIAGVSSFMIPNFLIVFWAFRIFTILFIGRIFRQEIILSD